MTLISYPSPLAVELSQFWTHWAWPGPCFTETHPQTSILYCNMKSTGSRKPKPFHGLGVTAAHNTLRREGDWENGWFYTFALEQFMGMVQTLVATQWCYQGWLDSVSGVSKVEVVILHSCIRPNLCPDGSWWNNLEWGQHSPSCTEIMLKRCFRLPVVNSMKIFFHLVLTRFMWITTN